MSSAMRRWFFALSLSLAAGPAFGACHHFRIWHYRHPQPPCESVVRATVPVVPAPVPAYAPMPMPTSAPVTTTPRLDALELLRRRLADESMIELLREKLSRWP